MNVGYSSACLNDSPPQLVSPLESEIVTVRMPELNIDSQHLVKPGVRHRSCEISTYAILGSERSNRVDRIDEASVGFRSLTRGHPGGTCIQTLDETSELGVVCKRDCHPFVRGIEKSKACPAELARINGSSEFDDQHEFWIDAEHPGASPVSDAQLVDLGTQRSAVLRKMVVTPATGEARPRPTCTRLNCVTKPEQVQAAFRREL